MAAKPESGCAGGSLLLKYSSGHYCQVCTHLCTRLDQYQTANSTKFNHLDRQRKPVGVHQ